MSNPARDSLYYTKSQAFHALSKGDISFAGSAGGKSHEADYFQETNKKGSKHYNLAEKIEENFFKTLESDEKTRPFAQPDDQYERKFYKFVSGPKTVAKLRMINNCVNLYTSRNFYKRDS